MKNILIIVSLISLIIIGCSKNKTTEEKTTETPTCIKLKILDIKNEDVWNPPAKVFSYIYKGETVYYIPPRCCDIESTLFNNYCEMICSPDGGFTGKGDGKCTDFFESKTDEKLIWEDDRL